MRQRVCFLIISFGLFFSACEKKPPIPEITMLPPMVDEMFYFRGYVTDGNKDLVSNIYKFTRQVVQKDTINGHPGFVYISQNKRIPFYNDENGTLYQRNTESIGFRVAPYGLVTEKPVEISYWQTMLKMDEGVHSTWTLRVDTTFHARTKNGERQKIRYIHGGKAKFDGWTTTLVPAANRTVEVLDAHWVNLDTYIINATTGDTLFSSVGDAHYYFTENFGAVKFINDFVKKEPGKPARKLYATWENVSRYTK